MALKNYCTCLCLFLVIVVKAQEAGIPLAYRDRVNALYHKIQTEIIPLPLPQLDCPISKLASELKELPANQQNFETWWVILNQLRDNGNADCCYLLLDALEPNVRKNQAVYLKWLYEKSTTLSAFQLQDSALVVAQKLKTLADQSKQFQGWAALAVANVYFEQQDLQNTLKQAEIALDFARRGNDNGLEGRALSLIGRTSRGLYFQQPERSAPFVVQAFDLAKTLRDTSTMISELLLIGACYDNVLVNIDKQFDYVEQAVALLRSNASLKTRANCIRMLGYTFYNAKDYSRSLPLQLATIALLKELKYKKSWIEGVYMQVANIYLLEGIAQNDAKKYDRALAMLDTPMISSTGNYYLYKLYAEILEHKGDYKSANKYHNQAFDILLNIGAARNISLSAAMETRLRTHETEILLEQQTRQRWWFFGVMALLGLLFALAAYAYWLSRKNAQKIALQKDVIEKQSQELRHLDEAKNRFYANVSHELRTPLTLILGPLASTLKRNRLEQTDVDFLSTAQNHSHQLLNLINEILDLSKLEAGKMQLHETTVGFQPFMRRLVSAFESHAERLNIHFQFEYRAEKHLRLALDTEKLTKIVNNLLSNALKFTPQGGSVSVRVEDLARVIRLKVVDTGRGIHPDDLPNVFDRFYQTNQLDAPIEGGTGIGLALCRELVTVLQGKIWVESEWDQGSCFYVEFPKKEVLGVGNEGNDESGMTNDEWSEALTTVEGTVLTTTALLENVKNDRPTLLIVEDNPDLRAYTATLLREANYHILEVENGAKALDLLAKIQNEPSTVVQLIISDIMMPVMDGFQLLKVLKDHDDYRAIPVVMLTARADMRDKLSALRIGVDDYLLKPFEEDELLARVENLLRNHQNRLAQGATVALNERVLDEITTPLISHKDLEWLAELEKVVAASMTHFDFNAERVAELLFMSRSQFFIKIKLLSGINFNEYVQEMRLNQARTGLENRQYTAVKAAAISVGFKDVRYFSDLFRKRFGKLPSDYLG